MKSLYYDFFFCLRQSACRRCLFVSPLLRFLTRHNIPDNYFVLLSALFLRHDIRSQCHHIG